LNPDDAGTLRLAPDAPVVVSIAEQQWTVGLRVASTIPRGVAALSVGLPQIRAVALPAWGTVNPAPSGET
jgi:hypothetical protein